MEAAEFMNKKQTAALLSGIIGMSESHIRDRLMFRQDFPSSYNFGGNNNRWKRADIMKWIESRKEKH